jgi:hypothetical protein
VVAVTEDKRPSLKFVIQIEDRPSYIETAMLGRLERKLRVELGDPPPPPSQRDKPRQPDPPKEPDKPKPPAPNDPTEVPVLQPREP